MLNLPQDHPKMTQDQFWVKSMKNSRMKTKFFDKSTGVMRK